MVKKYEMLICIRTHLGLTAEEFARSLNVPKDLILSIENEEKTGPIPKFLANAIYTVYGYDVGTDLVSFRDTANRVKLLRGDMTRREFVNRTGVTGVGNFERGIVIPGDYSCQRMAECFCVDESWILFGFGKGPEEKARSPKKQDEYQHARREEARKLKKIRIRKGLTQAELGQKLGYAPIRISKIEAGVIMMPEGMIEQAENL